MYSNDNNILNLIKILKQHNICDIVISPGGTNMNLVKKIQDDPFFNCYSVVDERSAIYFAIGLYLQTGRIIATSCTSAQATRNYIPGLTEAYYKRVPILAITMSKHPRFTYQEYMQAPDQSSLPHDCVKKSFTVPFISDENDMLHSARVINEAILELTHHGNGPVQLCIPSLDNKINFIDKKLFKISKYYKDDVKIITNNLVNKKIMIVVGEHRPFDKKLKKAIDQFCLCYNCCVYVNHLSNFNSDYSLNANFALLCMKTEDFKKIKPDILISIGGQTGDYPFYNMLSKGEFYDIEHWRISIDGDVVDTYDKLTSIFEMDELDFFEEAIKHNNNKIKNTYYMLWKEIVNKKTTMVDLPFSNASVAKVLSNKIKCNSIIQFSILNSLRIWNLFPINSNIECYSNVGAFGIDGGMSTLIGQSFVTEKDCYMIIGDLAFLYDINSLSIRNIKNNVKILLLNNNGGVEFKLYRGNTDFNKVNKFIAAGNHFKNAKGWSETCGFKYISASSTEEFNSKVDEFVSISDKPIVFELFINDIDEVRAYNILLEKNSNYNLIDYTKKSSSKLKNKIKNIINK